jgi:ribosomal protein S5
MAMRPIKRYEQRTIFGTVSGKVGATELELYARPPGMYTLQSRTADVLANCL